MLRRSVEPQTEPVSLDEAKQHLRVDFNDDDVYIQNLIAASREYVEDLTARSLITQTWVLYLDRWPRTDRIEQWPNAGLPVGAIMLPRYPVQSITSIVWTGSDASVNTLATSVYQNDLNSRPPRIALAPNQNWPSQSLTSTNGVQVTFVAGYGTSNLIPRKIRQAQLLMMGHWYNTREEVAVGTRFVAIEIPKAAEMLLAQLAPIQVG